MHGGVDHAEDEDDQRVPTVVVLHSERHLVPLRHCQGRCCRRLCHCRLVLDVATAACDEPTTLPPLIRPSVPRPSLLTGMPPRTPPLLRRTSLLLSLVPNVPVLLPARKPLSPSGAPTPGTLLLPRAVLTWSLRLRSMWLPTNARMPPSGMPRLPVPSPGPPLQFHPRHPQGNHR
jgi:hypothetical protein